MVKTMKVFFCEPAITSGWNMFDLHLPIGSIISKKYERVAKKIVPVLKGVISIIFL